MKIQLTIELDLPSEMDDYSDTELRQLIFDSYINYNTCSHLTDALEWKHQDSTHLNNVISHHHSHWGDISRNAVWSFARK